ncbi:hypothetical protein [Sinorhizobium fredii]|uniref:hypothetical protein n=1 Tax=Rhizobium fredii TaxID=380 RepID=UPI0004BC6F35|nr:hypothetical protein [Sinorhizobium fredii]
MTATISERIQAAEAHLTALRAKRGSALLDGENIDAAEYANAEHELAALRDAEGELVRRERDIASGFRKSRQSELRARLKDLERKRIDALQAAEEGARQLAAALERALSLNDQMAAAAHEITGAVPTPLQALAFTGRLSNRLSAVMSNNKANRYRFGNLVWPHSMAKAGDSWAVEESRLLEPHLKPILEK